MSQRGKNSSQHASDPAAVLLSGGMDSSVLLHYVVKHLQSRPVFALTFYYGQRHLREVEAARHQVAALADAVKEHLVLNFSLFQKIIGGASTLLKDGQTVPELTEIEDAERDQPPTYVPNRNMILLALAAAFAESRNCTTVYYGAQAHDEYGYWDCTPDFVSRLNQVFGLNRRNPIKVAAPFAGMHKTEEIKLGRELGVDFAATWSCYRGGQQPCQVCPTCVERRIAFHDAGVEDPLAAAEGSR